MFRGVLALAIAFSASVLPVQAQEPRPARQCPELLTCRAAEVNLQNYYFLPLTFQGQSGCAQFCSADYWVLHASTGALLLEYGHGGPMGPPLLAWGSSNGLSLAADFQLRKVVWVYPADPRWIDDGWYEETTYTWDAAREVLVAGMVRRFEFDERDQLVRRLEDEGMRVLFAQVY